MDGTATNTGSSGSPAEEPPKRAIGRYRWAMPSGAELRAVTCRGCGIEFRSHRRSVVYCCDICGLMSAALRSSEPYCFSCSSRIQAFHSDSRTALTPEQYWEVHSQFEPTHRVCLRAALDREVGEARQGCRCKACRRDRGELLDLNHAPSRTSRNAKKRSASSTYLRNRILILERDAWVCQICRLPLDRDASVVDDLYPQVDHILPVSLGGNDELSNLRAAHRWCNWVLGDSMADRSVRAAAHARFATRFPAHVIENLDPR